jgi:hypothetical protein
MVGRYPFLFPSVYRTSEHSIQYTYFLFRCRCGNKFNHWVLSVLVPQYQNHIFIRQRSYEIHANSFQRPFWSLLMVLYDLKVWLLGIQYIYQHIIPLLHLFLETRHGLGAFVWYVLFPGVLCAQSVSSVSVTYRGLQFIHLA